MPRALRAFAVFCGHSLRFAARRYSVSRLSLIHIYVAGLTCILGHAFPCYYKFKGGKGVVVTAATIAVIDWRIFLVLLGIFILVVAFSKYISLGSVCGMLVFPLLVQVWDRGLSINVLLSCLISALVIFLHRGNIKRCLLYTSRCV